MAEEIRERVLWRGQICTVVNRKRRTVDLRDAYGFLETGVSKKEIERLNEDDERRAFTIRTD